jgi:hypothetical protein
LTLDELDTSCLTLFGKPSGGYGITPKLAKLCRCSIGTVRKWKDRKRVPAMAAEIIRIKVLAKEISER